MAGGKRMRFRACVIVGDKKGRIGMAIAKGADVSLAVNKAVTKAKKHIMTVPIINETIPHRAEMRFSGAQVMIKPAPKGTGVMAGGAMRAVLELAGVANVVGKSLGSSNKLNCVKATLGALEQLKPVSAAKKAAEKVATAKASS
jgi:small subunit ribosomal protein S5